MNWILFGFKGVGKTTLGRHLAKHLRYKFVDTDQLIEEKEGLSCREIALQLGGEGFRKVERGLILGLSGEEQVISLGGGAILDLESRAHLEALGTLLYLTLPFSVIEERILTSPLPSFLDPKDPKGSLRRIYEERKEIYEKIPAQTIDGPLSCDSIYQVSQIPHLISHMHEC